MKYHYLTHFEQQRRVECKRLCLCCLTPPVCREAQSLCVTLSDVPAGGLALDLSPELTRAVTNVICSLCFDSSYRRGDPEFEAMLRYSQGIVDTVAKDSLVDIFPWLQVGDPEEEEL